MYENFNIIPIKHATNYFLFYSVMDFITVNWLVGEFVHTRIFSLFHNSNLRKLKSYRILRKIPKISFLNCNKKSVISTAAYRIIQFKNIMQHDQSAQAHKSNNIFSLFFEHTATRLVITEHVEIYVI